MISEWLFVINYSIAQVHLPQDFCIYKMKGQFVLILVVLALAFQAQAICDPISLLFRTHDGSCNNVINPAWGKNNGYYMNGPEGREIYEWAEVPRVVPSPPYSDAASLPGDGPRGNARNISNHISRRYEDEIDPINHSMFAIQYGQFICHDIDSNMFNLPSTNNASDPAQFPLVSYLIETEGEPMCETAEDYCVPEKAVLTSMARSSAGVYDSSGRFKTGNGASPFFDMDHIYGRSDEVNKILRTLTGGKLLLKETGTFTLGPNTYTFHDLLPDFTQTGLPINPTLHNPLNPMTNVFTAGDDRVNENIALIFFHTMWAREHNRVCDELMEENFLWKLAPAIFDELIYQKARAITIAKYQHVIYEQYFPSTFGTPIGDSLGSSSFYNPTVEAATLLAFSSGAFRYGHFSIRNYMALDECGRATLLGQPTANPDEKISFGGLTAPFPAIIQPIGVLAAAGGFENVARGLTNERAAPVNGRSDDLIRNLPIPNSGVVDLIALDIMRARFNQLPNYQKLRVAYHGSDALTNKIYGLPNCPAALESDPDAEDPLACFVYITGDVEAAETVKASYKKINLIDAVIGLGVEQHVPGATVGRTLGNILVAQFKRSRE